MVFTGHKQHPRFQIAVESLLTTMWVAVSRATGLLEDASSFAAFTGNIVRVAVDEQAQHV